MNKSSRLTLSLLHILSNRLSGRLPKTEEYYLAIGLNNKLIRMKYNFPVSDFDDFDIVDHKYDDRIEFIPNVLVFPSVHKRHRYDKIPVLEHVLNKYFRDTFTRSDDGNIVMYNDTFVKGVYKYHICRDGNYRSWIKVYKGD